MFKIKVTIVKIKKEVLIMIIIDSIELYNLNH